MNEDVIIDDGIYSMPLHTNGNEQTASRSDAAEEIVSRKPDFLERWALLFFLGILLLLLGSTWFIRYPDVIEASATLTATNAPKEIIPRQAGRLVKLLVKQDDVLKKGQAIAWLESNASHIEVLSLSEQLDSSLQLLHKQQPDGLSRVLTHQYNNLGELQSNYQQFVVAWQQFDDYLINGFYNRKKQMLQQDIVTLHQMKATVNQQAKITEQDVRLSEESFQMNEYLYNEKIISKEEYRNQRSKLLSKQAALPQLSASKISNEAQRREKQKEIYQLEHDIAQQRSTFEQALGTLKSAVNEWMRGYILQSPVDGKIVFTVPLQEARFVQQGKLLGYVIPDNASYFAELTLPQNNFGKISKGLNVQLRFNAYPYQEFGFVRGRLDHISGIPSDSGFLATVRFDKGLTTNYGQRIQYKNGLKAQAIVITRNMRLMQRIYYNIVKATSVKKNQS